MKLFVGVCSAGLVLAVTGCQTWTPGMNLPSPRYLQQPPQYIPPSPPFPLSRDLAAQEASKKTLPTLPPIPEKIEAPAAVVGKQKSIHVKQAGLEDFSLKTDRMTFNNFSVVEIASERNGGLPLIKLKGCYRNRTKETLSFALVVVGYDENEDPVWASTISGKALGKDVGCLPEATVLVPPGTLKRTTSLRFSANLVASDRLEHLAPGLDSREPTTGR